MDEEPSAVKGAVDDWSNVSSVFTKHLLAPNKHYYVTDPTEVVHALSRQRSIRARSSSMIIRSATGTVLEDNRHQALREEVAIRKQIVQDVERSVAIQRGTFKALPLSLWTNQYDKYCAAKLEASTVCGASSILAASSTISETKKVRGASARLYSPPREQSPMPLTIADLRPSKKFTPQEEAKAVRRLYDERFAEMKQRQRHYLRRAQSTLCHVPQLTPAELTASFERFYERGVQQQKERREKLLHKYLSTKPSVSSTAGSAAAVFNVDTSERLYHDDMEDQAAEMRNLVEKYADGDKPVGSKYAPKVSKDELDEIFVRVRSRSAAPM